MKPRSDIIFCCGRIDGKFAVVEQSIPRLLLRLIFSRGCFLYQLSQSSEFCLSNAGEVVYFSDSVANAADAEGGRLVSVDVDGC